LRNSLGVLRWSFTLIFCLGCVRGPASPTATLREFAQDLRSGETESAYALLSDDYRRRVSLSDFQRRVAQNPEEVAATVTALDRPRDDVEITAHLTYGDGEAVELVLMPDGFYIRGDPTDFYPQATPAQAARSFVRAMRRARYDVVLRFVPRDEREGVTVEALQATATGDERDHIAEMLVALEAHIDGPFERHGDRATLSYAGGRTLRLVREDDVWRIASPE